MRILSERKRGLVRASLTVWFAIAGTELITPGCGGEDASPSEPGGEQTDTESAGGSSERDAGSAKADATVQPARDAGQPARDAGRGDAGAGAGTATRDSGANGPARDGATVKDEDDGADPTRRFSFFVTSQAGLEGLAGNAKGFGGDLRFGKANGLDGADEICRQLAESSMPDNGKTWRAFLSVTKGPDGAPVNAIDRIGEGPWYDRTGRLLAMNKAALMNTRPQGADPVIANDLPNEEGVPNHDPGTGTIDNHNTMTGSTGMGTLDTRGLTATCQDWTDASASGGKPHCGVTWPRGQLQHWISTLDEGGCAPGATPRGAEAGPSGSVGGYGGYGGFYCFALTP